MMSELEQRLIDRMREGVSDVISGNSDFFKCRLMYPSAVVQHLVSLGIPKVDFDSNGWDYDYWVTFKHDGRKYILSGSGYYGDMEFALEEDDE